MLYLILFLVLISPLQAEAKRILDYVRAPNSSSHKFRTKALTNIGTNNLLVVLLEDPVNNSSSFTASSSEVNDIYFGADNSLQDYYDEVSDSRLKFTGTVIGPLQVNNVCDGVVSPFDDDNFQLAIDAIEESIGSLDSYDMISFFVPDDNDCLDAGVAGIASIGDYPYTSSLTNTSELIAISFIRGTPLRGINYFEVLDTINHELGHNLGLEHDNANTCGELIFTEFCDTLEYGGAYSLMGLPAVLSYPSSVALEQLDWFGDGEVLTITNDGYYNQTLDYLQSEDSSSIKTIKVRRDDGDYYFVENRRGYGYQSISRYGFTYERFDGFLVYLDSSDSINPILFNVEQEDLRDQLEFDSDSDRYVDSGGIVTFALYADTVFADADYFYDSESEIVIKAYDNDTDQLNIAIFKGTEEVNRFFQIENSMTSSLANKKGRIIFASAKKKRAGIVKLTGVDLPTNFLVTVPTKFEKLVTVNEKKPLVGTNAEVQVPVKIAKERKFFRSDNVLEGDAFKLNLLFEDLDTGDIYTPVFEVYQNRFVTVD